MDKAPFESMARQCITTARCRVPLDCNWAERSRPSWWRFWVRGALDRFRESEGWKAGVDGSVSLVTLGAGGAIDTNNLNEPIVGFVLGQKGLMYNLSFEGTKFTKLDKK